MRRIVWLAAVGCGPGELPDDPVLDALRAPPDGSVLYGAFGGHTPCDEPCLKLKAYLTLHGDADDGAPTRFVFERVFVGDGDTRYVSEGTWEWLAPPAWFPEGAVLRTTDDPQPGSVLPEDTERLPTPAHLDTWLVLRDVVLVGLDDALEPRVGDGSESWTLDRVE